MRLREASGVFRSAPLGQTAASPGLAWAQLVHALPWGGGIAALILGTNYIPLPTSPTEPQNGNSLAVWMFLAYCARIVTG